MTDIKNEQEGYECPPFIKYDEDMAQNITGESQDGDQMILGEDVLIFFKLMGFEQGTLNRLRQFSDQNLQLDIDASQGFIYLGELDEVEAELHRQIRNLFTAIKEHRNKQGENSEKQTKTGN